MLPELNIHSHEPLLPQVLADTELGYEAVKDAPDFSIALVKNGHLRVKIIGAASALEACSHAGEELHDLYRIKHKWARPRQNIVAVTSFAPFADAVGLAGLGVDAWLARKRPPSHVVEELPADPKSEDAMVEWARPGPEDYIIKSWLEFYKKADDHELRNRMRALMFLKQNLLGLKDK